MKICIRPINGNWTYNLKWNDAFRKIFLFKRFESVRTLQVEFGSIDFQHLYDLHRWVFLKSIGGKCVYWSKFECMLNIQFHICDDHFDKYVVKTGFNCSFEACIFQHCRSNVTHFLRACFIFDSVALYCVCFLPSSFSFAALVANKGVIIYY